MRRTGLFVLLCLLVASTALAFNFGFNFKFGGSSGGGYADLQSGMVWQTYTPTPGAYSFGNHSTSTNTDKVFTLSNPGNDVLEAASLAVAGTGFSLQSTTCGSNPFDLALLMTCTATVRFSPVAGTSYSGTLTASAPNLTSQVVNLGGTGVESIAAPSVSWNGDHASGVTYGIIGGTPTAWSALGPVKTFTGATTPGVASPDSGKVYEVNNTADSGSSAVYFTVTSSTANLQSGYVSFYMYPAASTGTTMLCLLRDASSNYMLFESIVGSKIKFVLGAVNFTSTATYTLNGWNKIEVRWSSSNIGIRINDGSWDQKGSGVPSTPTTPTYFALSDWYGVSNPDKIYLDGVKLWRSYDQSL